MIGSVNTGGGGITPDISSATITVKALYGAEVIATYGNKKIKQTASSKLPSAYREVVYVKSSGGAYIDTGIPFENGWQLKTEFSLDTTSSAEQTVLGFYGQGNADSYRVGKKAANSWYTEAEVGGTMTYSSSYSSQTRVYATGYCAVDASLSTYMFGQHDTVGVAHNINSTRIYYVKIYDISGVLIYDYVPCVRVSDSAVGFYELVNGTFKTKAGTGTLTAGDNVLPINGETTFTVNHSGVWQIRTINSGKEFVKYATINRSGDSVYKDLTYMLPDSLQEVEYLQLGSSGTAKYDADFIPTNHCIEAKAMSTGTGMRMFGENYNNVGADNFNVVQYNSQIYAAIIDGTEKNLGDFKQYGTMEIIYNYGANHQVIANGDVVLASANSITCHGGENCTVWASCTYLTNTSGCRYYYFNALDRSTNQYIRILKPCYVKSAPTQKGFWDCVSERLFVNQGTGTILVGGDVD